MEAKDYKIYCKDGNLYINRSRWTQFCSDDSKCFSKEDLESIEKWIEQNNEYIRKDDFVEKACNYLQKNIWRITYEGSEFRQRFVTDFKKYIKGE